MAAPQRRELAGLGMGMLPLPGQGMLAPRLCVAICPDSGLCVPWTQSWSNTPGRNAAYAAQAGRDFQWAPVVPTCGAGWTQAGASPWAFASGHLGDASYCAPRVAAGIPKPGESSCRTRQWRQEHSRPSPGPAAPAEEAKALEAAPCAPKAEELRSSLKHQLLEHILGLAEARAAKLSQLLGKGALSAQELAEVRSHRAELLKDYESVILADVEFAEGRQVCQLVWRHTFSGLLGSLGSGHRGEQQPAGASPERLLELVEGGSDFFETLLAKLQKKYGLDPGEGPAASDPGQEAAEPRALKAAVSCAQECLLCLGDLARHREQARGGRDLAKARSCFLRAQQLDPREGRPYEQLAVLAVCAKRPLDAVYYLVRSLAAPRPSASARTKLRKLFQASQAREREERGPGELRQTFTRTFLQAHGLLFTGRGMEAFPSVAQEVLQMFQLVLRRSPAVVGRQEMLRLMAINMFAMHQGPQQPEARSTRQGEEATGLALAMCNLLLQSCTALLGACAPAGVCGSAGEEQRAGRIPVSSFSSALHALLPSVKLCCELMLLWGPPWERRGAGCPHPWVSQGCREVWLNLDDLGEALALVSTSEVALYSAPGEELSLLVLEEDQLFMGFGPFLTTAGPEDRCYMRKDSDKEIASGSRRVQVLRALLKALLCRKAWAHGKGETQGNAGADLVGDLGPRAGPSSVGGPAVVAGEQEVLSVEGRGGHSPALRFLEARKCVLAQRLAEEKQRQVKIRAILEAQRQSRQKEEEIRVTCLVLDTNVLVKHLELVIRLLARGQYKLLVPLIVIHELKGLCKGQKQQQQGKGQRQERQHQEQRRQHQEQQRQHQEEQDQEQQQLRGEELQHKAQIAMAFLKRQFELRTPHLKSLSYHGQERETIAYEKKDIRSPEGNNDDRILSCCLNYHRAQTKNKRSCRQNWRLRHHPGELALVTDDRTLRVKALASHVPAWDIKCALHKMGTHSPHSTRAQ